MNRTIRLSILLVMACASPIKGGSGGTAGPDAQGTGGTASGGAGGPATGGSGGIPETRDAGNGATPDANGDAAQEASTGGTDAGAAIADSHTPMSVDGAPPPSYE